MPTIEVAHRFDWDVFVRRYWNRKPVLYRQPAEAPFTFEAIFEAATEASRPHLEDGSAPQARSDVTVTVEKMKQHVLAPWLPRAEDGGFDGYDARLAPLLDGRRYALILSRLHASAFGLWDQERDFFSGLWRRVGLPLTGGITTLFHGNYEHSPVGVHLDRFTTFLFALRGRKRMRFWKKRPWKEDVSTVLDYAPYLASSFAAEVEPGDILYWPSTYYHVGESVGAQVTTSLNIGIPITEHRPLYSVQDVMGAGPSRARAPRPPRRPAPMLTRGALTRDGRLSASLPAAFTEALSALRDASHPREARLNIQAAWLKRASAGGFEPVPPHAPAGRLGDEALVRVAPGVSILFEQRGPRDWSCAANGHVWHGSGGGKALARFFSMLNTGHEAQVGTLLEAFRAERKTRRDDTHLAATREGMRSVLEKLQACRAIARADASA
ncbi:cupin [Myxococcus sp. K15C18031901]|uniref:JmjC domain-containing protein n=1 Tax=Myxococcus dinghuensis TaxID=2906761 RepID=UPI0020A6F98E|nr:cupin domain-containing protein [Myxococcus dinghuensis]MCP3097349.1 cupin [Myxococcus dinghuensis]